MRLDFHQPRIQPQVLTLKGRELADLVAIVERSTAVLSGAVGNARQRDLAQTILRLPLSGPVQIVNSDDQRELIQEVTEARMAQLLTVIAEAEPEGATVSDPEVGPDMPHLGLVDHTNTDPGSVDPEVDYSGDPYAE